MYVNNSSSAINLAYAQMNHADTQKKNASKDIFDHIQDENLNVIKKMVSRFPECLEERKGYSSNTPLLAAASSGKLQIVKYFVDAGADVFATNSSGNNVFTLLMENKNLPAKDLLNLFEKLCAKGLDIDMKGSDGRTALMKACSGHNLQLIKGLVKLGADIEARNKAGDTVLMAAILAENISAIDFLISEGVDLDACGAQNHNAFMHSIKTNSLKSFSYFLKKVRVNVNQQDWFGTTPLMWASFNNRIEMVRMLLKEGADITLKTSKPISVEILPHNNFPNFSFHKNIKTIPVGSTAKTIAEQFDSAEAFRLLEKAEQANK